MKTRFLHTSFVQMLCISALAFCACQSEPSPEFQEGEVQGYKPLYETEEMVAIQLMEPRPLKNPGKIYVYHHWLLVNEQNEGIHFFNNSNPASPQPVHFLKVRGNIDMAIRNDVLYVDHVGDMVALRLTGDNNYQEISRIPRAWSNELPPDRGYHFECVDPEKGVVVGWVLTKLESPRCFR